MLQCAVCCRSARLHSKNSQLSLPCINGWRAQLQAHAQRRRKQQHYAVCLKHTDALLRRALLQRKASQHHFAGPTAMHKRLASANASSHTAALQTAASCGYLQPTDATMQRTAQHRLQFLLSCTE